MPRGEITGGGGGGTSPETDGGGGGGTSASAACAASGSRVGTAMVMRIELSFFLNMIIPRMCWRY